jgi:hypothetical protein
MEKCPCSIHSCKNVDDYVILNGVHCEECFRDCVEIDNE